MFVKIAIKSTYKTNDFVLQDTLVNRRQIDICQRLLKKFTITFAQVCKVQQKIFPLQHHITQNFIDNNR